MITKVPSRIAQTRCIGWLEWEDSRRGRALRKNLHGYFLKQSPRSRRFFKRVASSPEMGRLLETAVGIRRSWRNARGAELTDAARRLNAMLSPEFAREKAPELMRGLSFR